MISRDLEAFGVTLEWNGDRNVIVVQDGEIVDMEPCAPEPMSAARAMKRLQDYFYACDWGNDA